MWIIYVVVLHILLLGSIFVIYFRSPVITNLNPQPPLSLEAPAKRLVLFVTDGLRAESFFQDQCKHIPHLKRLIRDAENGLVGISHTRVPTESRPGHIALIAGLYEDPSAVTRGWKENPIEFDTVFNRSEKTYAWGANDVLHIFSRLSKADEKRLFFDSYSHELDFSGKEKTYELDQWVFEKVEKFLQRKSQELQTEEKVVYFLHLLGLDTAGHVHKPNTELFLENLLYTQEGITKMYQLFESTFKDGKTAYVLTSDHGMTNAGSHGAGETFETETPFFVWGAGINPKPFATEEKYQLDGETNRPLYRLEQAQIAPLMSALLGIGTPMNNFGILPRNYINASQEYISLAAQNNAYQLEEQYQALLKQHQEGYLTEFLPKFNEDIEGIKANIRNQVDKKQFALALDTSYRLMESALKGIEYYFGYYRWPLLAATTATFVGFMGILLKLLLIGSGSSDGGNNHSKWHIKQFPHRNRLLVIGIGLLILSFCLLQQLPISVSIYLLLPTVVWYFFVTTRSQSLNKLFSIKQLLVLIACSELLVYSFFDRRAISLGFLLFTLYEKLNRKSFSDNKLKFFIGLLLGLILIVFPLLPNSVGYSHNLLIYLGIALTILRSFLVKVPLNIGDRIVALLALTNGALCIYRHSQQHGLLLVSQILSWSFLAYILVVLVRPSQLSLKQRLERLIFLLTSLYCLFCTSYEAVFVLLLITELMSSVDGKKAPSLVNSSSSSSSHISECFRYAFLMLLYTFFSFFGTGNIASISSFDPNIIRCFLTTFSPFVIMFLVILKLIIPLLLIMSIILAVSPFALQYERQIFICLLILCDIMGLNFLFLVKNQGSWLEIGSSISHFVIMEVTTLVLIVFVFISKLILKIRSSDEVRLGYNGNKFN
ncbi:phosphatidylinositol glycan anchor biosynthesis class N [Musca autumnalis]|uniref:phosphatidylinositol glycan anchor biosynthesis class N n=1 Tax=Musca autumnalis TaxID=221902 RepID=UPI003CF03E97